MKTLDRKLRYLSPDLIEFSPNNPRGLSGEQIIRAPEFNNLVASISKHGVLEPLIIKAHETKKDRYTLIDGERRLRAALQSRLGSVPTLIAKDDTDGRILAYQVHMLRQNWSKPAETRAIKSIIADIQKDKPDIGENALLKELREITAHKSHELSDIRKLAKYSDDIIMQVLDKKLDMSYLIQIESSFINRLKNKYKDIFDEYGEDNLREILIGKAINDLLGNTRFLMEKFKVVFADESNRDQVRKIICRFLDKRTQPIEEALNDYNKMVGPIESATKKKERKGGKRQKDKSKAASKTEQEEERFRYRRIKITRKQQTLIDDIQPKYEKIARLFSDEEYEYINEAIYCLKRHCFKASVLMIWAAGMSKILKFISLNIPDFNNSSIKMKEDANFPFKYYVKNFKTDATSIDEIRETRDRQLLCYLFYKHILSKTQIQKLIHDLEDRNSCGHPTDIDMKANEVVAIFDNLYDLVFDNSNLA